jgi:hypothetical protein
MDHDFDLKFRGFFMAIGDIQRGPTPGIDSRCRQGVRPVELL